LAGAQSSSSPADHRRRGVGGRPQERCPSRSRASAGNRSPRVEDAVGVGCGLGQLGRSRARRLLPLRSETENAAGLNYVVEARTPLATPRTAGVERQPCACRARTRRRCSVSTSSAARTPLDAQWLDVLPVALLADEGRRDRPAGDVVEHRGRSARHGEGPSACATASRTCSPLNVIWIDSRGRKLSLLEHRQLLAHLDRRGRRLARGRRDDQAGSRQGHQGDEGRHDGLRSLRSTLSRAPGPSTRPLSIHDREARVPATGEGTAGHSLGGWCPEGDLNHLSRKRRTA
jgi:hypothetical protein